MYVCVICMSLCVCGVCVTCVSVWYMNLCGVYVMYVWGVCGGCV